MSRRHRAVSLGTLAAVVTGIVWVCRDGRVASLVKNSLLLASIASAIALVVGALLALVLVRCNTPWRRILLSLLAIQLFTPLYLQAAAWKAAFGTAGELLGYGPGLTSPLLDGWSAAIWIHSLASIPWVVLIVGIGLVTIEPELEEAALLDASPARVLCMITARRAAPFLLAAGFWSAINIVAEMTVTDLFQIRTYAEQVYLLYALGDDTFFADIQSLTALFLVGLGSMVAAWGIRRSWTMHRVSGWRSPRVIDMGPYRWFGFALAALTVALLFGVPLAMLVRELGLHSAITGATVTRVWSPGHAVRMLSVVASESVPEFQTSVFLGVATATIAVLLAAPLAWWSRTDNWRFMVIAWIVGACLALPGPVIGSTLVTIFSNIAWKPVGEIYDRTLVVPVLALLVRSFPLPAIILMAAFRDLPQDQIDMAVLEGGRFAGLSRLVWAQRWRAFLLAWLTGAIVSEGDVSASILVMPPGFSSVPLRVFGLLHSGVTDKVAALCLMVLLACGIVAALVVLPFLRGRRSARVFDG